MSLHEVKPNIKLSSFLYIAARVQSGGGKTNIHFKHRVVIMGQAFTGKTQIVSQFLYDKFNSRYRQTVEELHRGEYDLPDGSSLTLDILDTSGAFQFPAMQALSISTSNAFILVFSIDSEESWEEVVRLREKVWEELNERNLHCNGSRFLEGRIVWHGIENYFQL